MTIVCFLLMDTAPLARHVVTIMGSISGVSPTATEMPNRNAFSQSPFVMPLMKNTNGTITIMNLISTHETALTPLVKLVSTDSPAIADAMEPNRVRSPLQMTTACALPEITLLPMNAMFWQSVIDSLRAQTSGVFSTGALSPVKLAWLTNRSLASRMRTSAGIISPADRRTTSPTTRSSMGISDSAPPSRITVQVVVIMDSSFSAALPLLDSCTKRSVPEITTMVRMMVTVMGSKSSGVLPSREKYGNAMSVMAETVARKKRMAVKGLTNASTRRLANDFRLCRVTAFEPYCSRFVFTVCVSSPR